MVMRIRWLVICLILSFGVVACGGGGGSTEPDGVLPTVDSPRATPLPTETPEVSIPPTWTPQPTVESPPTSLPNSNGGNTGGSNSGGTQRTHTVAAGDTLGEIATAYNVTLDALIAANPQIGDINTIEVGDVINIP
ncbi:MAG TPA: LysM peptidoglycan-binding domain-containing protein [Anaerolineae bacterium]|nr:LysM peptidoglycan-binding domain-containing protein [Anaerolineae bacterium]